MEGGRCGLSGRSHCLSPSPTGPPPLLPSHQRSQRLKIPLSPRGCPAQPRRPSWRPPGQAVLFAARVLREEAQGPTGRVPRALEQRQQGGEVGPGQGRGGEVGCSETAPQAWRSQPWVIRGESPTLVKPSPLEGVEAQQAPFPERPGEADGSGAGPTLWVQPGPQRPVTGRADLSTQPSSPVAAAGTGLRPETPQQPVSAAPAEAPRAAGWAHPLPALFCQRGHSRAGNARPGVVAGQGGRRPMGPGRSRGGIPVHFPTRRGRAGPHGRHGSAGPALRRHPQLTDSLYGLCHVHPACFAQPVPGDAQPL